MNQDKQMIVHLDDDTYVINPFLTTKGLRIKAKIAKHFGPSISTIFSAEDDASIIELIAGVFTQISEDEYVELVKEILSNVTKNNMTIDFEREFSLNYSKLFKLIKEVLQFNYKDLFSLLDTVAI